MCIGLLRTFNELRINVHAKDIDTVVGNQFQIAQQLVQSLCYLASVAAQVQGVDRVRGGV